MSFDMDTSSLPDDLTDVAVADPSGYREQAGFAPPKTGNYVVRILDMKIQTDADGNNILDRGYPVVVVNKVQLVESGREVYLPFQKFTSKPDPKRGAGETRLADLIRAHNDQLTWGSATEAIQVLEQEANGGTFRARLTWMAKDGGWCHDQIEALGLETGEQMDSDDAKRIFGAYKIKGEKKFPADGQGNPIPQWEGPSGTTFDATTEITTLYSSGKDKVRLVTD